MRNKFCGGLLQYISTLKIALLSEWMLFLCGETIFGKSWAKTKCYIPIIKANDLVSGRH